MENYDDSDISSESEFDGVSITESDDSQDENLEPVRDEYYDEYYDKYYDEYENQA
jgi:hypothetical protein